MHDSGMADRHFLADDSRSGLLFDVKNADLIPSCMSQQIKEERNKGQVKDLWDVWWVLGLAVGLLGLEWLTRKLLRLA